MKNTRHSLFYNSKALISPFFQGHAAETAHNHRISSSTICRKNQPKECCTRFEANSVCLHFVIKVPVAQQPCFENDQLQDDEEQDLK